MRKCIVLIYNSFEDPLFQNILYKFIQIPEINKSWRFHLVTFEQPEYRLSVDEKEKKEELKKKNIIWHPQRHLTGRFLLFKKLFNVLSVFSLMLKLRVNGVRRIWAFANIAASIGFIYKRLFGFGLLIYSYEPHSEFMKELGLWSKSSLKYKVLHFLETRAGLQAEVVVTGTSHMVELLRKKGAKGRIVRIPTLVDESDFFPRNNGRGYLRAKFNIPHNHKIVLYLGKFGGLYYGKEIGVLFRVMKENIPNLSFVVISQTSKLKVEEYMNQSQFPFAEINFSNFVSYEDVKLIISGSDIGISAVPPSSSQKFRSPTKVGEYLLCGLPYITCAGVSEDDFYAEEYDVGVVLKSFEEVDIISQIDSINNYMNSKNAIHNRNIGMRYRGYSEFKEALIEAFNA